MVDVLAKFGAKAAKERIDQVIVGMGPGPFTGLRTGIVFAQSFAFAQGLPIHGVCSLDALAFGIELPEFIVATDARRKELYWAKLCKWRSYRKSTSQPANRNSKLIEHPNIWGGCA